MKRMLKRLFLFLLILTTILFIWVLLPFEDSGLEIKESNYFICSSISIRPKNAQILDEVVGFKFKEKYAIESKWTRSIVKSCGRFLLPLSINLIAHPKEDDSEDFNYLAVIKSSRLGRIIQIPLAIYRLTPDFKNNFISKKQGNWRVLKAKDKNDDIQCFAWCRDTILLSSDEKMFNGAFAANIEEKKFSDNVLLKILINNECGLFEYYVDELKDEASYNIFRSADELRKINISLLSSDIALSHKGFMAFEFRVGSDLANSKKDVRFFMQLIRRVMDANSYAFKYNLEENINSVKVKYNLQKIRREN